MAATLPGRTYGLGLITSPLLEEFPNLGELGYTQINLVATLIGSLFCLPCGWLVDKFGTKRVLAVVLPGLALAVLGMSQAREVMFLSVMITLTRGFGQSMLSVISLAMLGKWFRRDSAWPMAIYAVLMTMLMACGMGGISERLTHTNWRTAWTELGLVLLGIAPLTIWLAPGIRNDSGIDPSDLPALPLDEIEHSTSPPSASLGAALRHGSFWTFALGVSLFALISSGVLLLQQSILAECGLSKEVFFRVQIIGLVVGLIANLLGGWAMKRVPLAALLSVSLWLLAGALMAVPLLRTPVHAYLQGIVFGFSGGLLTVLFFAVWGEAFGARHLGRIQGVAQMMTVLASASGPLIVAWGHDHFGSYFPILRSLAIVTAVLALIAPLVRVPSAVRGDWKTESASPLLQKS